jgi:protein SCO1/2
MKLLSTLLLSLALLLAGCSEQRKFISTDLSMVDWGKDFQLTDHNGKVRRLADFQGKAVVLFFGYTQCPDVCPTTLSTMREAMALLGDDAKRVQVLFATVDPARDTPQLLAQYVPSFHPDFLGLYGDEKTIAATAKDFKVFYLKQPGKTPDSYSVDHSTGSYAFDPHRPPAPAAAPWRNPGQRRRRPQAVARRKVIQTESNHEKAAADPCLPDPASDRCRGRRRRQIGHQPRYRHAARGRRQACAGAAHLAPGALLRSRRNRAWRKDGLIYLRDSSKMTRWPSARSRKN